MKRPIGIFDSGIGGLTVLQSLSRLLPCESVLYFADFAHLPYGEKSCDEIIQYSLESALFLMQKEIKLLVVACHTASCCALKHLEKALFPTPVLGMIAPSLQLLKTVPARKRIALLATERTIQSEIYASLLPHTDFFPIACPHFVPFIEEERFDHPDLEALAKHYLTPLREMHIETALLACTHYSLITPLLKKLLGETVELLDPAEECAKHVKAHLSAAHLLNPCKERPCHQFYTSAGTPDRLSRLSTSLLSPLTASPRF